MTDKIYLTLAALPLRFTWQWPVRPSEAGSDWHVIHGTARLEDGGELKAEVAVAITETIREAIGSLEPAAVEPLIVNAARKELDFKQIELLKSSKKQPVQVSSRVYDFKRNRLVFAVAGDAEIRELIRQEVYWNAKRREGRVLVADPTDAIFLNSTPEHLVDLARELEKAGELQLDGAYATATPALMARAAEFEAAMKKGVEELEKKHAYEQLRA